MYILSLIAPHNYKYKPDSHRVGVFFKFFKYSKDHAFYLYGVLKQFFNIFMVFSYKVAKKKRVHIKKKEKLFLSSYTIPNVVISLL